MIKKDKSFKQGKDIVIMSKSIMDLTLFLLSVILILMGSFLLFSPIKLLTQSLELNSADWFLLIVGVSSIIYAFITPMLKNDKNKNHM